MTCVRLSHAAKNDAHTHHMCLTVAVPGIQTFIIRTRLQPLVRMHLTRIRTLAQSNT